MCNRKARTGRACEAYRDQLSQPRPLPTKLITPNLPTNIIPLRLLDSNFLGNSV